MPVVNKSLLTFIARFSKLMRTDLISMASSIKEWVPFFCVWSWWGMNRTAGQTNCENREAFLGRFVCSALRFIPHEPRKKDTHSLYFQCFNQRSFLKFSEKSYKFKFLLFTDTLNLIRCKSLRVWFGQLVDCLIRLCSSGIESKIFAWFNEGNIILS